MEKNYLYGLTVQGIQSYIFATNKLKQIIGASEIIEQLCTTWFDSFLTNNGNNYQGEKLLNAAGNIRFKTDEATAKAIFKDYHKFLLEKSPGVPFSQAVVKIENDREYEAIQKLDEKLRGQRNKPQYAFDLGIMPRRKDRRTGNFATPENQKIKDKNKMVDVVSSAKYDHSDEKLLTEKINIKGYDLVYPSEFKELAKDSQHSWLAVVHIDGNGMGLIIKGILKDTKNIDKFTALKTFSENIGKCTLTAFQTAIKEVVIPEGEKDKEDDTKTILPIRPLIIGGDDVTLIIRADLAIDFTKKYLETFEKETKEKKLNKGEGVTAAAGIAYVKEKFPFHYAANLAEELCTYAKNKSKREASCLQFHLVQDSIIDTYKEIRKRELTTSDFEFISGPYYLDTCQDKDKNKISDLLKDVKKLKQEGSPKNGIREWIDAKFNKPTMASILKERLEEKAKEFTEILKKEQAFIDYHTLLSINTKTDKS